MAAATTAIGVGMAGAASAAPVAPAAPAAVGGGGRTTDTIHSDATRVGSWEKFTLTCGH